MKKVGLYTLGCKLNFSETSALRRQFEQHGFAQVDFHQPADVYVINTCSVTDNADKKCRKVVKEALRTNPGAYVVVVGCYAQLKPQEIAGIPGVDLVLGANEKFRMFEIVSEFTKQNKAEVFAGNVKEVEKFNSAYSLGDRTRSFLKIQDGCDYKCSFCTIPQARGKSRSGALDEILANANELAENGVKEIVITGVNIGDYGVDQPHTLLDVVRALDDVKGISRFRISSIEPNLLTEDIIRFVAESKRFMPHFHVPLQSGNDEILASMRRRYKRALYEDRVRVIRRHLPHASIGVDVITGFPGETDAHFLDTYRFLNELEISYLHVFTYSERANTPAAVMPGKVPGNIRADRSKMLHILSDKKRRHFYDAFLGQMRPVLFEREVNEGNLHGFTDNYIKVTIPYDPLLINEIRDARLVEVDTEGMMRLELDELPQSLHA